MAILQKVDLTKARMAGVTGGLLLNPTKLGSIGTPFRLRRRGMLLVGGVFIINIINRTFNDYFFQFF
jgi:hypothetical protein